MLLRTLFFVPLTTGGGTTVCLPGYIGLGGGGGAFEPLLANFESSSSGTFPLMR
jgi:hypothetical protein